MLRSVRDWAVSQQASLIGAKSQDKWLTRVECSLTGIVGSIRQISYRKARVITGLAIAKLSGAVAVGGIAGLISAFGTASTGTAIGTLSGAAATSATLYWVGSLFGLGAIAGGSI